MASREFTQEHWLDADENPAGGVSFGEGFTISWQNGPLGRGEERREPNGAFVETLIQAVIGRIEFYQEGKFACKENADALEFLDQAWAVLNSRTQRREAQEVEGTHEGT